MISERGSISDNITPVHLIFDFCFDFCFLICIKSRLKSSSGREIIRLRITSTWVKSSSTFSFIDLLILIDFYFYFYF